MEANVSKCGLSFRDDELQGFEIANLSLKAQDDGELAATLIRTKHSQTDERPAVLYLHGFVDYFFQEHLALAFEKAGYRFYALDLRRYGRSLRPNNRANMANSLDDYFEEISWAVNAICQEHPSLAALIGHSTGGLIASLYMARGPRRSQLGSLIVNSPFLRFNLPPFDLLKTRVAGQLARFFPYQMLPDRLKRGYGKSLHKDEKGEWDYDLKKKPLDGFPLYPIWFRIIHEGHRQIARGLDIQVPILCLFSDKSRPSGDDASEPDKHADLVLNVEHIRSLAPQLGSNVTLLEIAGGLHDLTLSTREPREKTLCAMTDFLKKHAPS